MLSEALPAQSWDFGDRKVDRAKEPVPEKLGPAWFSLGVAVRGRPRHVALWIISFSNNEQYVAERRFCSPGTLQENFSSWMFREKSVVAKCRKVFCLNLSKQKQTHQQKNGAWKTGLKMTFII
jgi:hypothetical protein